MVVWRTVAHEGRAIDPTSRLGSQVSTRILGRRTHLLHLSLFPTASRMVFTQDPSTHRSARVWWSTCTAADSAACPTGGGARISRRHFTGSVLGRLGRSELLLLLLLPAAMAMVIAMSLLSVGGSELRGNRSASDWFVTLTLQFQLVCAQGRVAATCTCART